jgi:hypothetical protein
VSAPLKPSALATPAQVRALLAGDDLDDVTRSALQQRLVSQERLAAGHDPFAGIPQDDADEWWVA